MRPSAILKYKIEQNSFDVIHLEVNEVSEKILVSIVVPVFNQESTIRNNLESLITNLGTSAELILVNDCSSDGTDSEIHNFLAKSKSLSPNLRRISYYKFKHSLFETRSDHFGILKSSGSYIIEVQADMCILEPNFDRKLVATLENNPDLFMLSCRGIMTFREIFESFSKSKGNEVAINTNLFKSIANFLVINLRRWQSIKDSHEILTETGPIFPSLEEFSTSGNAGRLGRLIDQNSVSDVKNLYVGETVMRGPICFSKDRYMELGGFNVEAFFLGFDEHDLNLRARVLKNWKAGYTPISFESPLKNGSMRKKRSLKTRLEILVAIKRTNRHVPNSELFKVMESGGLSIEEYEIRTIS